MAENGGGLQVKFIIYGAIGVCLGVYLSEAGALTWDQINSAVESAREWIQSKMATANNLEVIDTV
jgi:hypothetical protein